MKYEIYWDIIIICHWNSLLCSHLILNIKYIYCTQILTCSKQHITFIIALVFFYDFHTTEWMISLRDGYSVASDASEFRIHMCLVTKGYIRVYTSERRPLQRQMSISIYWICKEIRRWKRGQNWNKWASEWKLKTMPAARTSTAFWLSASLTAY